jgi:hypothetical protein
VYVEETKDSVKKPSEGGYQKENKEQASEYRRMEKAFL